MGRNRRENDFPNQLKGDLKMRLNQVTIDNFNLTPISEGSVIFMR